MQESLQYVAEGLRALFLVQREACCAASSAVTESGAEARIAAMMCSQLDMHRWWA